MLLADTFSMPKNLNIKYVPLFELFIGQEIYGQLITSIPHIVSRWLCLT